MTPPSSAKAVEAALAQNPYLTALPSPKAEVLAPPALSDTAGTAEILRLPEIQTWLTGDFLILPCDLVCDLPGDMLLDIWLKQNYSSEAAGGLGVWYSTKSDEHIKGCETDFLVTAPLAPALPGPSIESLDQHVCHVLNAMPTDSLNDLVERKKALPIRRGMLDRYGKVDILTAHRDAHIYIFPSWIKQFAQDNDHFDSISEDIVGWWAKASWQKGLGDKLHIKTREHAESVSYAPSILAYVHPASAEALIRRVDTSSLLLRTSISLAALPALTDAELEPSMLSHVQKIAADGSLIAPHTTIHAPSTLVGPETSIATHCNIRTSCIGASCNVGAGSRISGSVLMDGVQVDAQAQVQGCIIGRRAFIGKGSSLNGCEVQEGFRIEPGTVGKPGEKFSVFEGLENGLDELDESDDMTSD